MAVVLNNFECDFANKKSKKRSCRFSIKRSTKRLTWETIVFPQDTSVQKKRTKVAKTEYERILKCSYFEHPIFIRGISLLILLHFSRKFARILQKSTLLTKISSGLSIIKKKIKQENSTSILILLKQENQLMLLKRILMLLNLPCLACFQAGCKKN